MKKILISTSLLTLIVVMAYGYHYSRKEKKRPIIDTQQLHINSPALKKEPAPQLLSPDFVLTDINGNKFKLSDHRGDIIVLNYWATTCKPCVDEIPGFESLQKELKNDKVLFVGISSSVDKLSQVRTVAKKININYPLMIDKNNIFAHEYQAGWMTVPMTFIVNHRGELAYVILGETSKKLIKPLLKRLIELSRNK